MRLVALIVALASASAAQAEGARETRYGPAPARAPAALDSRAPLYNGAAYGARTLGWTGKRDAVATPAETTAQQPWWAREPSQTPASYSQAPRTQAPPPQAAAPVPASFTPQAPAPTSRLPQSIYDAPTPQAYSAPTPQNLAAPQLQPGQVGARTYSVGRQFGMSPDPIPAAGPSRMVLIAPPPAATEDEPTPSVQDGGEWSGRAEKDSDR
ncbi:hypothetical protein CA606_01740 [Caulobacter vibrioides]|uniref:Uncharacterized protein n=1 Tax=Caulobacter vibrioides TaxID=155892 RepID=A0A290MH78_CAUVI|nr:hypothetical protein [Caulobacter vibrioides]ATC31171.1 hypothetical protein CA606_01740 [Caulobacter vibrioides]